MQRFLLSASHHALEELKEHLFFNGYHFELDVESGLIEIDEGESPYLKTILRDRGISFAECE